MVLNFSNGLCRILSYHHFLFVYLKIDLRVNDFMLGPTISHEVAKIICSAPSLEKVYLFRTALHSDFYVALAEEGIKSKVSENTYCNTNDNINNTNTNTDTSTMPLLLLLLLLLILIIQIITIVLLDSYIAHKAIMP